jgi:predicted permease
MKFRLPGKPLERLMEHSVENLTRLACIVALVALGVMVASILHPGPLLIIFATSVGQMIGGFAVLCYFLAVVMDVKRSRRSLPPKAPGDASRSSPSKSG